MFFTFIVNFFVNISSSQEGVKLIASFIVGFFGSAAYITALYFKFIDDDDEKGSRSILEPFLSKDDGAKIDLQKCGWYCVIGGVIASIFQFDVDKIVAVQSLILGATWPAIVSQFLSDKMSSRKQKQPAEQLGDAQKLYEPDTIRLDKKLEKLPRVENKDNET